MAVGFTDWLGLVPRTKGIEALQTRAPKENVEKCETIKHRRLATIGDREKTSTGGNQKVGHSHFTRDELNRLYW